MERGCAEQHQEGCLPHLDQMAAHGLERRFRMSSSAGIRGGHDFTDTADPQRVAVHDGGAEQRADMADHAPFLPAHGSKGRIGPFEARCDGVWRRPRRMHRTR